MERFALLFGVDTCADRVDEPKSARICVFIPLRRWSLGQWARIAIGILLGGAALLGIGYATWIGIRVRRWDIGIAVLALLPWWWMFGSNWYWLIKSIRRGGHPLVLLVGEHAMALGMDDEGTLVRQFFGPTLRETEHEMIIENSVYFMAARLPKDQVSAEHADLIRRCVRGG